MGETETVSLDRNRQYGRLASVEGRRLWVTPFILILSDACSRLYIKERTNIYIYIYFIEKKSLLVKTASVNKRLTTDHRY